MASNPPIQCSKVMEPCTTLAASGLTLIGLLLSKAILRTRLRSSRTCADDSSTAPAASDSEDFEADQMACPWPSLALGLYRCGVGDLTLFRS